MYYAFPNKDYKLPCIVLGKVNESGKEFADDDEILTEHNYEINIFSKTYEELEKITKDVTEKIKEIGFRREICYDIYEEKIKRKYIRIQIFL